MANKIKLDFSEVTNLESINKFHELECELEVILPGDKGTISYPYALIKGEMDLLYEYREIRDGIGSFIVAHELNKISISSEGRITILPKDGILYTISK
jgi:hypothetical protein